MKEWKWTILIVLIILGILIWNPLQIRDETFGLISDIASIFYTKDSSVKPAGETGEPFYKQRLRRSGAPERDL